ALTLPLNLRAQRSTRRPLRTLGERLGAGLLITVLIVLLVAPMAALALRSVARLDPERGQSGPVDAGLTLAFYRELSVNRRNDFFFVAPSTAIVNSLVTAATTV